MFENKYPYTDFHELNLDWVLEKIKDFEKRLDNLKEEWLTEAKNYTDEQVASIKKEVEDLSAEFDSTIEILQSQYTTFTELINAKIQFIQNDISRLSDKIDAEIIGANEYTNQAIKNNNEYLLEELSKGLSKIKVVNFFTGTLVTVQEMFDTLAQLHIADPLSYDEYADKNITYANLSLLNISFTDLVLHGKQLIP